MINGHAPFPAFPAYERHMQVNPAEDRFAAFRHRSYTLFFCARFLAAFATQIISVAVGWQMYEVTKSTFLLGMIGLVRRHCCCSPFQARSRRCRSSSCWSSSA